MNLKKSSFTLRQANQMLPLVRRITADIVRLAAELAERRQRFDHLASGRELENRDPYEGELAQVRRDLDQDARQLDGYIGELTQLGLQLGDPSSGAIDFPCEMEGRPACYCWRLGETEVLFWHEPQGCPEERRRLTAAAEHASES